MDWILDHLQIVIAAAAAVAYWLNQRKQVKEDDPEGGANLETQHQHREEVEDAARARRIREEIRRKIAERSASKPGQSPNRVEEPPPLYRREPVAAEEPPQTDWRKQSVPTPAPSDVSADSEILERQHRIEEQLAALRKTPVQSASITTFVSKPKMLKKRSGKSHRLRDDLLSKSSVRRAIVLNEVLGPPVGLR